MKSWLILKRLTVISQLTVSGKQLDFHLLDEASNRVPSPLVSADVLSGRHRTGVTDFSMPCYQL